MPEKIRMMLSLERWRNPWRSRSAAPTDARAKPVRPDVGTAKRRLGPPTLKPMAVVDSTWSPSSWRDREALQQPGWPDDARAEEVVRTLRAMPPLVFAGEARQ